MHETQVQSLGQEEMAAHSSMLAWEIPWSEEPGAPADAMRILSRTVEELVVYKDPYWQQCGEGVGRGQH